MVIKGKNKIFIGWDPNETVAYDVAEFSIRGRCESANIIPLSLIDVPKKIFNRPIATKEGKLWCPISGAHMATEFAISRFSVPFLTKGWALFIDCDIVCLTDINKLFELADDRYAVMVVKHQQESGGIVKMGDQVQTYYNRKNWSSVMLFNCDHPANKSLTRKKLNTLPGRDLHAFCWLKDDEIGELSKEWNYLVDVSEKIPSQNVNIAHYTLGGPWIKGWVGKESDSIWNNEIKNLQLWHNSH